MASSSSRIAGSLFFKSSPRLRCPSSSSPAAAAATPSRRRPFGHSMVTAASAGGPSYGALLLDVGGTLLETARPVPEVYAKLGENYGVHVSPDSIKKGFKKAFSEPWPERLRYEGDGRVFWRHAVATATGCSDESYFEELYNHFARGEAWKVAEGAHEGLVRLRDSGVKLAVVSNFDLRLRPLLRDLQVDNLFNAIIVSSEVGFEKPAAQIFEAALRQLNIDGKKAVHVGDDPVADQAGAQAVGMEAWLWKKDVKTFQEIVHRILE